MNWLKNIFARIFARHPATEFSTTRSWINYGLQDARKDLNSGDRQELQRLSRYFEAGNAIVNRMCDLWESYVVGANGLQFFPNSSSVEWNAKALVRWEQWKPFADISSRDGWDVMQGRLARSLFVDGEVFILLTREGMFQRVQMVESHRCCSPDNAADNIVDGVELDLNGRPVAYWFKNGTDDKKLTRYETTYVVHIFEPSRPGQVRGIPMVAPVLNDIRDLDDLQILEMRAAKNAARIAIVQKNKASEVSVADRYRQKFSVTNTSATGASVTQNRSDYYGSSIGRDTVVLQSGDELAQFMTNRPTVTTREFWRYVTEKICAGVGIPYVLVFPESMQGTVYRGAIAMATAYFRARSAALTPHLQRVYEWVIGNDTSLISGRPSDWRKTTTRPPRAPSVDIGYDTTAAINSLAAGLTSYQALYAERGENHEEALEQKAREVALIQALAAKYNVTPESIAASSLPAAKTEPQPQDEPMPQP